MSFCEGIQDAANGKYYDFKSIGNQEDTTNTQHYYRGMPLKNSSGKIRYGSARDVGNDGTGYVAGIRGIPWSWTRQAFDTLEKYKNDRSTEGKPSQAAQILGYCHGIERSNKIKL